MTAELSTHLWQSTWFALAAGLLTLVLRKNRANVRYWLWLGASLKFCLPFAPLLSLGKHLGWAPVAQRIATPDISLAVERFTEPLPLASSTPGPNDWTSIAIAGVWVCGVAAILSIRLRSWLRIRAAVGASTPLEIPAAVQIRSSPGLLEPGVVGWWRPILLLPEGILEQLTPPQLEAVLAHELCHVRRRDNLFASVHMVVEAAFWFHPLVWWIGARLVEERERACDEGVLTLGSEPRVYADAILNVCRLYVESPLVCVPGVTGANLKRRIEGIMMNRVGQGLSRTKKLLLACAGVVALAGPVAIGVVIGVGHVPAIRAQSRGALAPDHRRLVAMLFDFDALTADDQARMRQNAVEFVRRRMQPADALAIMAVNRDRVTVIHDFTDDRTALESGILNLPAQSGGGAARGIGHRLWSIESAVSLLGSIPGKKALMYFVIETVQNANVALYQIALNLPVPQPEASLSDEQSRRLAYVQQHLGSASTAMGRTYLKYGPPDQVDQGGGNAQVWRYNYLENFHDRAEFEFTPADRPMAVRITWPPPLATFDGVPGAAGEQAAAAGLPGRHAFFQIYPAGEIQTLSVPTDSLSGRVEIASQIKTILDTGAEGPAVASLRDNGEAAAGAYHANFILKAGSYVCIVLVREQNSGKTYGETIHFEVK
jgi:beta-lactamase regulating signal transducer with metallopeptidase domain